MGSSEGLRLLLLEIETASLRSVSQAIEISPASVKQWSNGLAIPTQIVRERVARRFPHIRPALWDTPALPAPPPLSASQIMAGLHADKDFLTFLTSGPPNFPATPQQRALIRVVYDNANPSDLSGDERAHARVLFGDLDTIPDTAREKAMLRLGRNSAKSTITAAYAVFRLLTGDLEGTMPHEIPTVVAFSSDAKTTGIIVGMAMSFLKDIRLLEKTTEVDNSEDIVFRRPTDDRRVRLRLIVRSIGGRRARGFPILAAVVDEAEFMGAASPDAVIQDEDNVQAMTPRFLKGAKLIMLSTPWAAESYAGLMFEHNWGKPHTAVAARGTTLFMRNGDPDIVARRERAWIDNERNCLREFDCEVVSMQGALIDASLVDAAVRARIEPTKSKVSAGVDLGFQEDWSALAVVERQGSTLAVVGLEWKKPVHGHPVPPSAVCGALADKARELGATYLMADSHKAHEIRRASEDAHIQLAILENKPEDVSTYLRDLFMERRIIIPNDPNLVRQLKAVGTRPKPGGGLSIIKPRSSELGHCDLVSALECAAWADRRHGPFSLEQRAALGYPSPAMSSRSYTPSAGAPQRTALSASMSGPRLNVFGSGRRWGR
jgi:hypothetical protein